MELLGELQTHFTPSSGCEAAGFSASVIVRLLYQGYCNISGEKDGKKAGCSNWDSVIFLKLTVVVLFQVFG